MRKLIILNIILGLFIFKFVNGGVFSITNEKDFPFVDEGNVNKVYFDDENNRLFVGGNFKKIRSYTGSSAVFNINNNYELINNWPKIDDGVHVIISDGNGGWYIGGDFNSVDGYQIKNLTHILPNGEVDQNFTFRFEENSYINALLINSSTLYIGGSFEKINNQNRKNLAAIDLNNKRLIDWSPNVGGVVFSLAISSSTLYVGGDFTSINNNHRFGLAAINLNDYSLTDWQPKIKISNDTNGSVNYLLISSSTLYVGGMFNKVDNKERKNLAAFDLTDNPNSPQLKEWNPSIEDEFLPEVFSMAIDNNLLYIFGVFSSVNGQERNNLAAIDIQTGNLADWRPDKRIEFLGPLTGSIKVIGENVYIGGGWFDVFDELGNSIRQNFAIFNKNNGHLVDFDPGFDFPSIVYTIYFDGEKVYIGGYFNSIVKEKKKYFAILSPTGDILNDNLIRDDGEIGGSVDIIKKFNNKTIIIGNYYFDPRFSDQPKVNFLKIFDDNNEIFSLETDGNINSLTIVSSTLYFVGEFKKINGKSFNNIGAVNLETLELLEQDPLGLLDNNSENIDFISYLYPYLFIEGKIQRIKNYNFTLIRRLIILNLVNDSVQEMSINGEIKSIINKDSKIYISGKFTNFWNKNKSYFVALDINSNGTISLSDKLSGYSFDKEINDLGIVDNILYLAGNFDKVNDQTRSKLAAINLEDDRLLDWNPRLKHAVYSLAFSSSSLYVGGYFNEINDLNINSYLAKFNKLIEPQIYDIKLNNSYYNNNLFSAGTSQVILTFNTDKPAVCRYSEVDTSFENMPENSIISSTDNKKHQATFSNLQNNTTYTYYLRCRDISNIDLKNNESKIVSFSIAQAQTGSGGTGGSRGGGGGGGGGGSSSGRITTSTITSTISDEALRSWLLQFVMTNLLSQQKQTKTTPTPLKQTKTTPTSFKSRIKGIPDGFQFTRTLKLGMKGQDVEYLQIFLKSQGENLQITGEFDNQTRQAVINFQEKFNDEILKPQNLIKGTGIVGKLTLKKINELFISEAESISNLTTVKSITSTDFSKLTTTSQNTSTIVFNRNTNNTSSLPTNVLSSNTNLIQLIQQLLSRQLALISNPENIPPNYRFTRILSFGMEGQDVRYLQIFLKNQGEKVKITGKFDNQTRQAVINFQEKYDLPEKNGIVDQATLEIINKLLNNNLF